MSFLDTLAHLLIPEVRSDPWIENPDLQTQLDRLHHATARPWRPASITEALGVPAIFRGVTLIANTVGSLSMEAFRNGARLDVLDTPRIVTRPNPLTTPREFFRSTAYAMVSRGEAVWWIAARDADGLAASLYPVPPQELRVEETRNRLHPRYFWNDREIPQEDLVQIPFSLEPGARRGMGPLQACGAAVSVSVEAQEWAANFFAGGGYPSVLIKSAVSLSNDEDHAEADALKAQWMETPNNMPKVIDPGIEAVDAFGPDPAGAQLTEQRNYQTGDAARMLGIPGSLLEYSAAGSSLTYQNVNEVWTQFVRATLAPNYLEPIEQALSDLLTRSTVSRFSVEGLMRADIKTRFEVHTSAIDSGVYDAAYARMLEGIDPGSVETAPVPAAWPVANVNNVLPFERRSLDGGEVRCGKCGQKLAEALGPGSIVTCRRCKTVNRAEPAAVSYA